MICFSGYIPTQYDIDNADRLGRWWYREDMGGSDRFQLLGMANNDWLNVKDEGENPATPPHGIAKFIHPNHLANEGFIIDEFTGHGFGRVAMMRAASSGLPPCLNVTARL